MPQGPIDPSESAVRAPPTRGSGLLTTSVFALSDQLSAKSDPALIAADERHFAAVSASLETTLADLTERLHLARRAPGGDGQAALDRDQEVHRLSARLRTLGRFSLDLCLGRVVPAQGEPVYIGRLGLQDSGGDRLLVDWRSPAAEPYFAATRAEPMGLVSRRRYRWNQGRIVDYWDEAFTEAAAEGLGAAALDEDSALLASIAGARTEQMRDVLSTISADQDAIIRASSRGALIVDGGPGTGKTVVALHRAAYLLYEDPRLEQDRGGVLFVGPHRPYLAYVADVLPGLGEDGVRTCTVRDLVPEGADAGPEPDPAVERLKSTAAMVGAIEPAVAFYEEPPTRPMLVETPVGDLRIEVADWEEAFGAADPASPHNLARDEVWEALLEILLDRYGDPDEPEATARLRAALDRNAGLRDALGGSWPLLDATDLVGDLWSVPAYLRRCAPWLSAEEVAAVQRSDPAAWTVSDLPLLDAARLRLGDREAGRRRRERDAIVAAQRAQMDLVVDDLIAAERETEQGQEGLMISLRQEGLRDALVDDSAAPTESSDPLAGPFAHIVVDEAQELTDAQWQMLLLRCPSRSFTVVGDRAQARRGFAETWQERLQRNGFESIAETRLGLNYRTPAEVMAEAAPVIRAVLPDANVPESIRESGIPVAYADVAERDAILADWLESHDEGVACVIGDPSYLATSRVASLTPELAKGLEFDLVVLVDPEGWGTGVAGAVDRYVAMTRTTQRLVVLQKDLSNYAKR